jgi:DeoR/GlpR family transcriptional regulator of sugar metabolism
VVDARRERLRALLAEHRYLPIRELCRRLGISEATARRDLDALVTAGQITRTYGGAWAEFDERFPSFRERQRHGGRAKQRLGRAALRFLQPGWTCFFDSGTTIHAVASALQDHPVGPLSIVTSNLPAGDMLAGVEGITVFQLAGQLLRRQSVVLGEYARRSLEFWDFDLALLSAEGMDAEGIWNSQPDVVAQQQVVLARSRQVVFILDASKVGRRAAHFLVNWDAVPCVLTDAPLAALRAAQIPLPTERYVSVSEKNPQLPESTGPDPSGESLPVHYL